MQRTYSMRDAYNSIYEKKEDKWPSIKDHKEPSKVNVKYDKDMNLMAPTVVEEVIDSLVEVGILQEGDKMSALDMVKKQLTDKYGKGAIVDTKAPKKGESDEEKAQKAKNYAANTKKDDPYKSRAGESD